MTGLKFGILILDQKELDVSAGTGIGFSNFVCADVCAAEIRIIAVYHVVTGGFGL